MTLGHLGGPITGDMNGPEVYATIFAVGPGKVDIEVIWTGSDDGLVHVTRDGGESWKNVTPPDMRDFGRLSLIDPPAFERGAVRDQRRPSTWLPDAWALEAFRLPFRATRPNPPGTATSNRLDCGMSNPTNRISRPGHSSDRIGWARGLRWIFGTGMTVVAVVDNTGVVSQWLGRLDPVGQRLALFLAGFLLIALPNEYTRVRNWLQKRRARQQQKRLDWLAAQEILMEYTRGATEGLALRIRPTVRESILQTFAECCPSGVIDGTHYDGAQLRAWIEDSAMHLLIQYHNTLPPEQKSRQ